MNLRPSAKKIYFLFFLAFFCLFFSGSASGQVCGIECDNYCENNTLYFRGCVDGITCDVVGSFYCGGLKHYESCGGVCAGGGRTPQGEPCTGGSGCQCQGGVVDGVLATTCSGICSNNTCQETGCYTAGSPCPTPQKECVAPGYSCSFGGCAVGVTGATCEGVDNCGIDPSCGEGGDPGSPPGSGCATGDTQDCEFGGTQECVNGQWSECQNGEPTPPRCNLDRTCSIFGSGEECSLLNPDCSGALSCTSNGQCAPGGGGLPCSQNSDCQFKCTTDQKCQAGLTGENLLSCDPANDIPADGKNTDCTFKCDSSSRCVQGPSGIEGTSCDPADNAPNGVNSACYARCQTAGLSDSNKCVIGGAGDLCADNGSANPHVPLDIDPDALCKPARCTSNILNDPYKCKQGGTGGLCGGDGQCQPAYRCTSDGRCNSSGTGPGCFPSQNDSTGKNPVCRWTCNSERGTCEQGSSSGYLCDPLNYNCTFGCNSSYQCVIGGDINKPCNPEVPNDCFKYRYGCKIGAAGVCELGGMGDACNISSGATNNPACMETEACFASQCMSSTPIDWVPIYGGLYQISTSTFYLKNSSDPANADEIAFGMGGSTGAIRGNWDGIGNEKDGIGVFYGNPGQPYQTFWLKNSASSGNYDSLVTISASPYVTDFKPLAGDWDGDGKDNVGLFEIQGSACWFELGAYHFEFTNLSAPCESLLPVAGDWDVDGKDSAGLFDPATSKFYLRNSNTTGPAEKTVTFTTSATLRYPLAFSDYNLGIYDQLTSTFYSYNMPTNRQSSYQFGPFNGTACGEDSDCQYRCDSQTLTCKAGASGNLCSTDNDCKFKCSGQQCLPVSQGGTGIDCTTSADCVFKCDPTDYKCKSVSQGGSGDDCEDNNDCGHLSCEDIGENQTGMCTWVPLSEAVENNCSIENYECCAAGGSQLCYEDATCLASKTCDENGLWTGCPDIFYADPTPPPENLVDDCRCYVWGQNSDCGLNDYSEWPPIFHPLLPPYSTQCSECVAKKPPSVTNMSVEQNQCSGIAGQAKIKFAWTYDGSAEQAKYVLEVFDSEVFDSEENFNDESHKIFSKTGTTDSYFWTNISYGGEPYGLEYAKNYYWRLKLTDAENKTSDWFYYSPGTCTDPEIIITSPTEGAQYTIGSYMDVTWSARNFSGNVRIWLTNGILLGITDASYGRLRVNLSNNNFIGNHALQVISEDDSAINAWSPYFNINACVPAESSWNCPWPTCTSVTQQTVNCTTTECGGMTKQETRTCYPVCTFTYGAWTPDPCTSGTQTRTYTSSPAGCQGGTLEPLTRTCTPVCQYTYSLWSPRLCPSTSAQTTQTRTYTASPSGCTPGTPVTKQICTAPVDINFSYSGAGSQSEIYYPVAGDWDNSGADTVGFFNFSDKKFHFKNTNSASATDNVITHSEAASNWIAISGDWDGNGYPTLSFFDPATKTFHIRNSNSATADDYTFVCYYAGYPMAGDWNGDGFDSVGIYNPGSKTFHFRFDAQKVADQQSSGCVLSSFTFSYESYFGGTTVLPVIGDWDGDGKSGIGVYEFDSASGTNCFYLKNVFSNQETDYTYCPSFTGTLANLKPVIGDWNNDGTDELGAFEKPESGNAATFSLKADISGRYFTPQNKKTNFLAGLVSSFLQFIGQIKIKPLW